MPMKMSKSGKGATVTTSVEKTEDGKVVDHDEDTWTADVSDKTADDGPWAQVDVEVGATVPTAAYANIKASVRVSVPTKMDEIADNYEVSKDWALERLGELVEEMQGQNDA